MELSTLCSSVRLAGSVAAGPVRFVRLVADVAGPAVTLLDEALVSGDTTVDELHQEGVVARVRVKHLGKELLLLLDGEQLLGAKQNRIFNASFLVAPGQVVELPVSCVERARWRYSQPGQVASRFESSETTVTSLTRTAKLRRVAASLEHKAGYDAGQGDVWGDVDAYLHRTGTTSRTAAFHDAYVGRRHSAEPVLELLEPAPNQVGIAAVYAGKLLSMDLFGSAHVYARAWRKVGRGLLAEAYEATEPMAEAEAMAIVSRALSAIKGIVPSRTPAPGVGETLHGTHDDVTFTGLTESGRVYHLVAVASA